jgi:hypothetical protein
MIHEIFGHFFLWHIFCIINHIVLKLDNNQKQEGLFLMVGRTFSLALKAEKEFDQDEIINWIDESFAGVINFFSCHTIAVLSNLTHEVAYLHIRIMHFTRVNESMLYNCLSSPPEFYQLLEIKRIQNTVPIKQYVRTTIYTQQELG